jgi:hypothetical protein
MGGAVQSCAWDKWSRAAAVASVLCFHACSIQPCLQAPLVCLSSGSTQHPQATLDEMNRVRTQLFHHCNVWPYRAYGVDAGGFRGGPELGASHRQSVSVGARFDFVVRVHYDCMAGWIDDVRCYAASAARDLLRR